MFTRIATPVESEESDEEDVIKFDIDDLYSETSNPADSAQASSDKTLQEEVRKLQNEVSRLHKSECCNQTLSCSYSCCWVSCHIR